MNEGEVIDRLYVRYSEVAMAARRYVCADHVPTSTGGASYIADFVAHDVWRSKMTWHGHEIKCSRSDWLTELKNPFKSEATKRFMHHWWLVVSDKAIVKDEELPKDWGLMTTTEKGLRVIVAAPRLDPIPVSAHYFAAFARALQKSASSEKVAELMTKSYGATMKELLRQNSALRARIEEYRKQSRQDNLRRLSDVYEIENGGGE